MWQILGILIVAALMVMAIKIAFVFLFLTGLIFRPKETLMLLAFLGVLALFRSYPAVSFILAVAIIVLVLGRIVSKEKSTDD